MNLLVLSVGRRNKLIRYILKHVQSTDHVILSDCSKYAPGLFESKLIEIVPRIDDEDYLNVLVKICKRRKVDALMSLIDPEIIILSRHSDVFESLGVKILHPNYESNLLCFDKYAFYKTLIKNNILTPETYIEVADIKHDLYTHQIAYPVLMKNRRGSASIGLKKVDNIDTLNRCDHDFHDRLYQEYITGVEIGIDVYVDTLSGEIIDMFAREKLSMRAGETDQSLSIEMDKKLKSVVEKIIQTLNLVGPLDIDIIKMHNMYYVIEVNTRFGGSYLHAHECGVNFIPYMLNNLNNVENKPRLSNYKTGILMAKWGT